MQIFRATLADRPRNETIRHQRDDDGNDVIAERQAALVTGFARDDLWVLARREGRESKYSIQPVADRVRHGAATPEPVL